MKGGRGTCQWPTEFSLRERKQPVTRPDGVSTDQPDQAHCEVARSRPKTMEKQKDSTRERKSVDSHRESEKELQTLKAESQGQAHSKQASSSPRRPLTMSRPTPAFAFVFCAIPDSDHIGVADQLETWAQPGFGSVRLGLPRAGTHEHGPSSRPYAVQSPVTHGGSSSDLPVSGRDTLEILPGEVGAVPLR